MIQKKISKPIILASFALLANTACNSREVAQCSMEERSEQEVASENGRENLYRDNKGEAPRITVHINNRNEDNDNRSKSKFHCCCCECGGCCCMCTILGIVGVTGVGVYFLGAYALHWFPQIHTTT